jgi:NAD(P)-dependent dehydrogenase (short-subunit alcohol dehydrogenase family)
MQLAVQLYTLRHRLDDDVEGTLDALAQAGARLLCVDRDEQLARQIAETVRGVPCAADVTHRADMHRMFETAKRAFGRVHGIVDIIGVAGIKPLAQVTDESWNQQFDIVLRHAFLAIQIGGEMMAADGGGSIAIVGSMSGHRAVPNLTAYAVSKAALHHLVRCAGAEYAGRGVRINAVAPGFVRTPRLNQRLSADTWAAIDKAIPTGRAATPAEIAGPLLFLASDLSAHMTGEVVAVDGGAGLMAALPDVKFAPAASPTP